MAKERTDLEFNLVDRVSRGLLNIQDGVKGLGASLVKVNQAAELLGRAFDAAAAIASPFAAGIKSAKEFERVITEVGVVTGSTGAELDKLRQAAEDASGAFSAKEAAEGLAELARAGLNAADSIKVLPSVLALAQGQGLAVAEAATTMTVTLTQFGLTANDAARAADVLAKVADATETSVLKVGNSFGYAAPLAKLLGFSMEEAAAATGLLAKGGFQGERAGTALRNVFSQLLDPTSKFSASLRQVGIQSTDFAEIIEELGKRADGGKEQILALDAEARPAIFALVQQGGAKLRELTKTLEESEGTAKRAAEAYANDFTGALDKLINAFDKAQRTLATPLMEAVTDDFQGFADEVEKFAQSEKFKEIAEQVGEFADQAVKEFATFIDTVNFDQVAESATEFISAMNDIVKVAGQVAGVMLKVGSATAKFIDYQIGAVKAVADFAASLPGVSLAVAAYEGATELASDALDDFSDKNEQAAKSTGLLSAIIGKVKEAAQSAAEGIAKAAEATRKLPESTEPAIRSIKQIQEELNKAAAAGDDYNTARLSAELKRAEESFNSAGNSALSASQKFSEADAALKKAIEGNNPEEIDRATEAWRKQKEVVDKNEATYKQLTETQTKGADEVKQSVQKVTNAQNDSAASAKETASTQVEAMGTASDAAQSLSGRIIALRKEFAAFGEVAAGEFEKRLDAINNSVRGTGTSMSNYVGLLERAAQRLRNLIGVQEDVLKNLETGIQGGATAMVAFGGSTDDVIAKLQQLERETYDTNGQFNLLSQQRLDKLRSEIAATTSAIQAQANALDELQRIAASGNERETEELRYQQELERIQQLAQESGNADAALIAKARAAAEKEHKKRLREIAERAAAERQTYDDADRLSERNYENDRARAEGREVRGRETSAATRPSQQPAPQKSGDTFNVSVNIENNLGESADAIAEKLSAPLEKVLARRTQLRG